MIVEYVTHQLYKTSNIVVTVDVIFITNTQNARVVVVVDVFAGPTYHVKARGSAVDDIRGANYRPAKTLL